MILKKEIGKKALEHEVSRSAIDKDWVYVQNKYIVLWILWGYLHLI